MSHPETGHDSRLIFALRQIARICLLPALAFILWGELGPVSGISGVSDKLQHIAAYFGLAVLTTFAFRGRSIFYAAAALILIGAIIEFLQQFVGRDSSVLDAGANAIGVVAGIIAGRAATYVLGTLDPAIRRSRP